MTETSPAPTADASPLRRRLEEALPAFARHAERRWGADRGLDLVQETLLQALRAEATYDGERPVGPWLRTIADRVAGRQAERERRAPGALEAPDEVAGPATGGDHVETVRALLAGLAPHDRGLVARHHLGGESVAEIAASLGAPEGTVKARLWRARRRLAAMAVALAAAGTFGALLLSRATVTPSEHAPDSAAEARVLSASARIVRRSAPAPRFLEVAASTSGGAWSVSGAHVVAAPIDPAPVHESRDR